METSLIVTKASTVVYTVPILQQPFPALNCVVVQTTKTNMNVTSECPRFVPIDYQASMDRFMFN